MVLGAVAGCDSRERDAQPTSRRVRAVAERKPEPPVKRRKQGERRRSFEPRDGNERLSFRIEGRDVNRSGFLALYEDLEVDEDRCSHGHWSPGPGYCVDRQLRAGTSTGNPNFKRGIVYCEEGRREPAKVDSERCDAVHGQTGERYRLEIERIRDPYRAPIVERELNLTKHPGVSPVL
jgi:hypothetical protein